jgi:hypothetical protein
MRAQRNWIVFAAVACALLLAGGQAQASVIDTTTTWNGVQGFGPFAGSPSHVATASSTYGQTFLVGPVDTKLNSVTFWVNSEAGSPVTVNAYVAQWSNFQPVNPIQIGATTATTNNHGTGGMEQLTFATPGGIQLQQGTYVAYITAQNTVKDPALVGGIHTKSTTGGQFVFLSNLFTGGSNPTQAWQSLNGGHDLAFRASLSDPPPQPVPSGLVLGGIGSCSLLLCAWRRRRQQVA